MRVFLDETECSVQARFAGEAVAAASALAEDRGRLVVEVLVVGSPGTELEFAL